MGDRENTGQQQQGPANTQPPLPPVPALPAPNPDQPHREEIEDQPRTEPEQSVQWFKNPDWHMVWITVLLFAVGVYTACVFHRQFTEMQTQTGILNTQAQQAARDSIEAATKVNQQLKIAGDQAKAARDNVAALQDQLRLSKKQWRDEQRPWISLQNVHPDVKHHVPDPDNPGHWYVTYDVVNSGHSPAVRVIIRGFITIHKDVNGTFRRDAPCGETDKLVDNFGVPGVTVFPGEPAINRDDSFNFRPVDTPTIDLGGDALVVCISYRDASTRELHRTKMLFSLEEGEYYMYKGRRTPAVSAFVFQDAETDQN